MKAQQTKSASNILMGRAAVVLTMIFATCWISGCGTIQVKPADKEDLIWASANLLGFHAIQKHPDYALKGEDIALKISSESAATENIGDILNPLILELSFKLSEEKDIDPIVVHSLNVIMPMIQVKPGAVPPEKMKLIEAAVSGYLAGVKTGRQFALRHAEQEDRLALKQDE
ncbi:MAG: hypothetical protein JSW39_21125 [Desulfobacterales bacterium]|nr:MAG: hypothetical protein JSW39_21125 [Desulfobacterales bacterium]